MAAFWLVRAGEPVERQPVVFLGSEGETGVIARDLDAYLWLLAGGFGPLEASMYPRHEHRPQPDVRLTRLTKRHAASARQSPEEVIVGARAEFPDFTETVGSWCR